MKKKIIIVTIITIAIVVAVMTRGKGLLEKRKVEVSNESYPTSMELSIGVTSAKDGNLSHIESYLATILPDKSINLTTKLAGYIESILVSESDFVKKGDILLKIDNTELLSTIKGLQSTLMAQKQDLLLSKSIYNRNNKLFRAGGLSKEKLEMSKVALELKRANISNTNEKISQIKHQITYLTIVAPFDGYIDKIFLHQGDLAGAGKPILSMSNGKKKLMFSYASNRSLIKKEQQVFRDKEKIGYIKSIYKTAKNGLINVEVTLTKDIDLPLGSNININVLISVKSGCIIPFNTLIHKKDGTYIMLYKKDHFLAQKIDIVMEEEDMVLIKSCPKHNLAYGSEVKLSNLSIYDKVNIIGDKK